VAARFNKSREASLVRADGVVWSRNFLTTPPRPLHLKVASLLFLMSRPPLIGIKVHLILWLFQPPGLWEMWESRAVLARLFQASCGNPRLLRISTDAAFSTGLFRFRSFCF